jgi:hypothetical protein
VSDFAPDGSPVALYARLPSLGEPELIHATVPAGAEIPSTQWAEHGEVRSRLRNFTADRGHVSGEMEYLVDERRLVHPFESKLLAAEELDADLRAVGLRRVRELDERGSWIEAAPIRS